MITRPKAYLTCLGIIALALTPACDSDKSQAKRKDLSSSVATIDHDADRVVGEGPLPSLGAPPNKVLVLGSTHLRFLQDRIDTDALSLVLDRLETWKPGAIVTEQSQGANCAYVRNRSDRFGNTAQQYCQDPEPALTSLGMTALEADGALYTALEAARSKGNASLDAEERRSLALLQMAAGDAASALTQWYQLDPSERIAADGITDAVLKQLDSRAMQMDESYQIAARLAARLSHLKVYPADDRSADHLLTRNNGEVWGHMNEVWGRRDNGLRDKDEAAAVNVETPQGFLDYTLFMNSTEVQRLAIGGDFREAARDAKNPSLSRRYLAWWQARGLRMAANVAEAAGDHPSERILIVVGASHKPYYEAYLRPLYDIEIVDASKVLSDPIPDR